MNKKELLVKLEIAIEQSLGSDPETGNILYPSPSYLAYITLGCIENSGMLKESEEDNQLSLLDIDAL